MKRAIILTFAAIIAAMSFFYTPVTSADQPDQVSTFIPVALDARVIAVRHQTENTVLYTEYDRESATYIGAFEDNGNWYPIVWMALDDTTFEDVFSPSSTGLITVTFGLNDSGDYDHFFHYYSTEYNRLVSFAWTRLDTAEVTISDVYVSDGIQWGKINGAIVQFTGIVSNGTATRIKAADAYATYNSNGFIVQNGTLISYVATVTE